MVWWIDKYTPNPSVCRSGRLCYYQSQDPNEEDRVFPSTNIMFNFNNRKYNAYDIYSLIKSGVNIFNIDRTLHDVQFFKDTMYAIEKAQRIPEMFPSEFYMPITIAITISINELIPINHEIDIIILKNVTNLEQYLHFKKQHMKLIKKPLILWLNRWDGDDIEQLIRFSDGVILDHQRENFYCEEYCDCALRFSKKFYKPVFYIKPNILKDYYDAVDRDRRIIGIIAEIVENHVDGIMITDNKNVEQPPRDIIRSIVRAISFIEQNISRSDYLDLSFKIRIPALPTITAALAASLAALECGAKALFVFTRTGISARWCAYTSPPCPIIAVTKIKATSRLLHLYRKVIPLFYDVPRSASWHQEWRNRIHFGTTFALKTGLFSSGAKLVVLSPSEEGIGYCNGFQIVTVPVKCDDLEISFNFNNEI